MHAYIHTYIHFMFLYLCHQRLSFNSNIYSFGFFFLCAGLFRQWYSRVLVGVSSLGCSWTAAPGAQFTCFTITNHTHTRTPVSISDVSIFLSLSPSLLPFLLRPLSLCLSLSPSTSPSSSSSPSPSLGAKPGNAGRAMKWTGEVWGGGNDACVWS